MSRITPFLMFEGSAEEAMDFYLEVFDEAEIEEIRRYREGEGGKPGSVMQARMRLEGQQILVIDSPIEHGFTFTPSISLFVECRSDAEIDRAFEMLSDGGAVLMPLDAYPFAARYGWVTDRFGVSWQLSLSL